MNFDDYQDKASSYAAYKHEIYPFFGLAEEAGEVLGKMAKYIRKYGLYNAYEEVEIPGLLDELGDTLWQLSECCTVMGYSLEFVAERNLRKLEQRNAAGTIVGEGDNR